MTGPAVHEIVDKLALINQDRDAREFKAYCLGNEAQAKRHQIESAPPWPVKQFRESEKRLTEKNNNIAEIEELREQSQAELQGSLKELANRSPRGSPKGALGRGESSTTVKTPLSHHTFIKNLAGGYMGSTGSAGPRRVANDVENRGFKA
jgi:hypothetical protein